MNLSIYDYVLPDLTELTEREICTVIPYKIIKPLSIHDGVVSLLVDVDCSEPEVLNIVCTRSYFDLHDFCITNPAVIATRYTYIGCQDGLHCFVGTE